MALLVIQHSPHDGILRFGETLNEFGHTLRTIKLYEGQPLPADLDDVDGIVTCGGSPRATDDSLPWLGGEMELLRQAHEYELPVVGLCLGAQILTRALGGEVGESKDGMQLGWFEMTLSASGREDPLHSGMAWTSHEFHWNRDEIMQPPDGARVLASSPRCKVESWALGLRTYAFQHHPEITRQTIDVWIGDEPNALEEAGLTREELAAQTEKYYSTYERLTDRLFHTMALVLMPVDRRYKGVSKALHH